MKAILVRQFGGPEVLQLADIGTLVPASGQALVRIKAAGVNPADTYMRTALCMDEDHCASDIWMELRFHRRGAASCRTHFGLAGVWSTALTTARGAVCSYVDIE